MRAGASPTLPQGTGFDSLDIPFHYACPDQIPPGPPAVFVTPCSDTAFRTLLDHPPGTIDWLPTRQVVPRGSRLPFESPMPVLFWGNGRINGDCPFAQLHPNGSVLFHADIIAATIFMLSRWEETIVLTRDEHRRFPASASVAYKQRFLDRPVVDEYALVLREWLKVLSPDWQPQPRIFSVQLSHDVDRVRNFPHLRRAARKLGGDLVKRRSVRQSWRTAVAATAQTVAPQRTAFFQGIRQLAQLSRENHAGKDEFLFITAADGPFDSDYDITSPMMTQCIRELQHQGFEIGLHAGYGTLNDPERLAAEKVRLDGVLGLKTYGGRQHYLRFQVPNTWRHWEQVGLAYDSTMTYADHEGFRCGTCHPFRPFDLEQNREMNLWERPLIVMDQTLRRYRAMTPEQGEQRILELAQRCKQVGGTFSLLWHNSSLGGVWRPWAIVYERVLRALAGR